MASRGRQPALAAPVAGRGHLLVGVVEEVLQLIDGEGPLLGPGLDFLDMGRGVALMHDLDRMRAEALLADLCPAVGRIDDVLAEGTQCVLVGAQRRVRAAVHRAQVGEPFVGVLGRPLPRECLGMPEKDAKAAGPFVDRREGEIPGRLLIAPAVHHRFEHLLLGVQQCHPIGQLQPSGTRAGRSSSAPSLSVVRVGCECFASNANGCLASQASVWFPSISLVSDRARMGRVQSAETRTQQPLRRVRAIGRKASPIRI